jgi:hypothetical protein
METECGFSPDTFRMTEMFYEATSNCTGAEILGPSSGSGFLTCMPKTLRRKSRVFSYACARALSRFMPPAVATRLGIGSSSRKLLT